MALIQNLKGYTKVVFSLLPFLISFFISSAQVNVVLIRGMGKTLCGESTDLCWSLSKGTQLIGTLKQDAEGNLNCQPIFTLSSVAVSVTNWVVISSTFQYEYSECSATVFALGTGNSRQEALNKAIAELGANNFSWRTSYSYQIVREEAITTGGQYDHGNTQNNGTQASTNNSALSQLNSLLHQLQQQVAAGNTTASQHTQNLIFDLTSTYLPEKTDEIISRITSILNGDGDINNNANTATNPHQPNNTSSTNHSGNYESHTQLDYAEGWTYLEEYQQLLNELINQYNQILAGGDPTAMLNLSEKLQQWVVNHQNIFSRFTEAQLKTWEKMLAYFTDMLTQSAEGAIKRMENINYVTETKAQNGYFPNIQTGAILYNPNERAPTPTEAPNNNGFSKGEFRQDHPGCSGPPH